MNTKKLRRVLDDCLVGTPLTTSPINHDVDVFDGTKLVGRFRLAGGGRSRGPRGPRTRRGRRRRPPVPRVQRAGPDVVRSTARLEEVGGPVRGRTGSAVASRAKDLPAAVARLVARWRHVPVRAIRVDVTTGDVFLLQSRRRAGVVVEDEVLVARVVSRRINP